MNQKRIHIIGIGGIGLSALAQLLSEQGNVVTGCDRSATTVTHLLQTKGIPVEIGNSADHIHDIDLIIYSDAVHEDNPERMRAAELSIPTRSYFQALGEIANQSKCLIAVAGAHGKTTTTAMLADVLEAAGFDPTVVVGSLRAKTKSNFRAGGSDYFIVEADEYLRHFLNFSPRILVITNIDADHLDYYKDLVDIQSAFRELAQKIPHDGFLVCDATHPNVAPILQNLSCIVVDYKQYIDPHLSLRVLPLNSLNAAPALAVADALKIDSTIAKQALQEFAGTWRRFEYKGKTEAGAEVYDDYAHHPEEIAKTLQSVREQFPNKKIIVAFHPHLYSRTKALLPDFAKAFGVADDVIVAPIFAAREAPDPSISNEILAEQIRTQGTKAQARPSFDDIAQYLEKTAKGGDLIVTMGAGDIYKMGETLVK